MEPVLAKAFAGFKVVAVSAHQIGFSAFLPLVFAGALGSQVRHRTGYQQVPLATRKQQPESKSSSQNRQFVQKVEHRLGPNHCRDSQHCVTPVGCLKHSQPRTTTAISAIFSTCFMVISPFQLTLLSYHSIKNATVKGRFSFKKR